MMFSAIPFRSEHLRALQLQPAQAHLIGVIQQPSYGKSIEAAGGPSYTVLNDGRIIACGGVVPLWEGRGMAWGLLSKGIPSEFIAVHRVARRMIEGCGMKRVEAYVDEGFDQGCRWMEMLGFELETPFPMRSFAGERDCYLYARVME